MSQLSSLPWLILLLVIITFLQKRLHFEIQAVLLYLTRRSDVTLVLFSLIFLPGVLLHELSHFVAARVLGVRTGRFSLIPYTYKDGRVRLGYVETVTTNLVQDALIGSAPLFTGGLFISYAGLVPLGLSGVWNGVFSNDGTILLRTLTDLPGKPDFWLWFYLVVVISTTMLPSSSDRRSWFPIGLVALVFLCLALISGLGPWMLEHLAPMVNRVTQVIIATFALSAGVQSLLLLIVWLLRIFLAKVTRLRVR